MAKCSNYRRLIEMLRDDEFDCECESEHQLDTIRATLLINFGESKHNTYGFVVADEGTTLDMLVSVLRKLTVTKPLPPDSKTSG